MIHTRDHQTVYLFDPWDYLIYLRRKHHYRSFGYKAYPDRFGAESPDRYYYDSLGLYEVSTKAP